MNEVFVRYGTPTYFLTENIKRNIQNFTKVLSFSFSSADGSLGVPIPPQHKGILLTSAQKKRKT